MRFIRLFAVFALVASAGFAADIVCESRNTGTATYNWNDTAAWTCYKQAKVVSANDYPGKNYPTDNYIAVIGQNVANNGYITEHVMNVDTTLGVLGKNHNRYTVTALADNGSGVIRVTTSAANTVATGDKVYCFGQSGSAAANAYGIWTATQISSTQFDLQGSTYASTITGGYCEFPAALKRLGYNTTTTSVGKWKIAPNVKAYFRGDVVDNWAYYTAKQDETYAMLRCGDSTNGGCDVVFEGNGPVHYKVDGGLGVVGWTMYNLWYVVRGTQARHATIATKNNGATTPPTNPAYLGYYYYGSGDWDMDWVDVDYMGYGTQPWISGRHYATSTVSLQHFTVSHSNYIYFANGTPMTVAGSTGKFKLAYGVFATTPLTDSYGAVYGIGPGSANAADATVVGPAVYFTAPSGGGPYAPVTSANNAKAVVYDRVFFEQAPGWLNNAAGGSVGSLMKDSIIAHVSNTNTTMPTGVETLQNNFFWQGHDSLGNPHFFSLPLNLYISGLTFDGNVLQEDSAYNDGSGDFLNGDENAPNSVFTVTFKNNVLLPSVEYDGQASTQWHSSNSMGVTSATNQRWRYYNNTIFATTDIDGSAFNIGHLGFYPTTTIMLEYRCNAVVESAVDANLGAIVRVESVPGTVPDLADARGLHHNGAFGFNHLNYGASYGGTNLQLAEGTRYRFISTLGTPGANDQYFTRMPQVMDMSRRLKTWAQQKYGQTFGNDRAVFAYLKADYNRLLDIPDLVSWVKAGWVLKEPSLYKACDDGSHVGAMVAPPSANPAVSGHIVAVAEPPAASNITAALE